MRNCFFRARNSYNQPRLELKQRRYLLHDYDAYNASNGHNLPGVVDLRITNNVSAILREDDCGVNRQLNYDCMLCFILSVHLQLHSIE